MSHQSNDSNLPHPMVTPSDISPYTDSSSRRRQSDGATDRRKVTQMNESRASGELEGSTLGSSSRDGERNNSRRQRSAFLLDSSFLPRTKSQKASQHRPRRSEPDRSREKRGPSEAEHTGSRKKSRLPWSRHKHSAGGTTVSEGGDSAGSPSRTSRDNPEPSRVQRLDERDEQEDPEESSRPSIGLDQDSIQIVNLALSLNESRKGNLGRSASHRVPSSVPHADGSPAAVGGGIGGSSRSRGRCDLTHSLDYERPRNISPNAPAKEPLPVSSLLPNAVDDQSLPHDISESTLARVAKTRRHFELFGEYLRLLLSLPPLKHTPGASSNGDVSSSRTYNPLQTIRNRKVRYREKCPINIEAEGWHDVGAIHEWVNTIGQEYSQQARGRLECLRLPRVRHGHSPSIGEPDDTELFAALPSPESVKQGKRSSSKAHRPRFDWVVPPAELLADAAWTEEGLNKTRMVDKDGNSLYPDAAELILSDVNDNSSARHSFSGKRVSLDFPSRLSYAEAHRGIPNERAGLGRGRPRHRFQSPADSSSVSTTDRRANRGGSVIRSPSSSSVSMGAGLSEKSGFSSPLSARVMDMSDRPMKGFESPYQRAKKGSTWANEGHRASMSSVASMDDRYNRVSLDAMNSSRPNSAAGPRGFFPSITANLSPQSSRSPSPSKKRFSRRIAPRHERGKSKHRPMEVRGSIDSEAVRKPDAPIHADATDSPAAAKPEPSPAQGQAAPAQHDDQAVGDNPIQTNSKLRGIFKGKGKLASLVGSEVSKVGDFLKKDHSAHSRHSSLATSATSEEADVEPGNNSKGPVSRAFLRRLPTLSSDDSDRSSRKELEKEGPKPQMPSISTFTSPSKIDHDEHRLVSDLESARENVSRTPGAKQPQRVDDTKVSQRGKFDSDQSPRDSNENFGTGLSLRITQEQNKKRQIKDPSVPFSLTRPPVTGLAQAEASVPQPAEQKRPTLSGSWTISERSIPTLTDLGVFEKREIERTRALLLSSGIKAREITRRAETVRDPPPEFLQVTVEPNMPIPPVTRLRECDLAAQNLQRRFEKSQIQIQQSMGKFPNETALPLKSQLSSLENLVSRSLAPRVQAAASDAENLSIQLNTTSTLALKHLSDTLDKGVRKRRRRLRFARRAGFVMLEWALVGMLWWVWLIVMAFKVLRSAFRGALSSIRWVLWL